MILALTLLGDEDIPRVATGLSHNQVGWRVGYFDRMP